MGFNCGIVGLPNVGKSTLFNALTKAGAESANYPFCTINPNVGMVAVPDERQNFITKYVKPKSVVNTTMEFVDIAGLVKGASKGEGLGNQFLTHIRQVDAIAHIVRCFDSEEITHVEGSVDPARDIEIINTELLLSDLEVLERAIEKTRKASKSGDKQLQKRADLLEEIYKTASTGVNLRSFVTEEQMEMLSEYSFLTTKPVMYIANVDDDALLKDNQYVEQVRQIATQENAAVIRISVQIEAEISELDAIESKEFLADMGLEKSGLEAMIAEGYKLLNLITFFTAGEKEVRAWTITKGVNAQRSAGKIHTDIEHGFIRAETVSYADFEKYMDMLKVKDAGKMRLEGMEYI
ncbi:redox-regulated ATPase YchF, partial [bacterium]|nr:redox-regulated ATPase YchF [bacterium]